MSAPRVFGIPAPSEAACEAGSIRYRLWFWAYSRNQIVRHRLGLHQRPQGFSIAPRCDWCGHRSPTQRAIAAANYEVMHGDDR